MAVSKASSWASPSSSTAMFTSVIFSSLPGRSTGQTALLLGHVVPVVDVQVRQGSQGVQIRALPQWLIRVAGFGEHAGSEVMNHRQTLFGPQQHLGQTMKIEPVVTPPASGSKAVVEVEPIDIDRHPLCQRRPSRLGWIDLTPIAHMR